MRIFGLDIRRASKAMAPLPPQGNLWRVISEPFGGAWQRNQSETRGDLMGYPTLFACMQAVSQDLGVLPFVLKQRAESGIWLETSSAAFSPVLRRPNHYQTAQQFREAWTLSRLQHGNTYALKQRDARGVVVKLYVLDPCNVRPLIAETGDVFYELRSDNLNLVPRPDGQANVVVPAREIIHDREITIHHPLVGVPPLCAAYWPAVKNLKILRSAAEFFGNNAQPGGILTAPGAISDQTATRLSEYWKNNFSGVNSGRIAVVGDGLKFDPLAAKSVDAQMIEQLRYSDEQICQAFRVPPFIVGIGGLPAGMKPADIALAYYQRALQPRIEAMEALLDDGLGISLPLGVECDLDPLLRMDRQQQTEIEVALVGGKVKSPDEARRVLGLPPTDGGDTLWGQHQDYPLGVLARRRSAE